MTDTQAAPPLSFQALATEIVAPNAECLADPRHRQFSEPNKSPTCMICHAGMRWLTDAEMATAARVVGGGR